MINTLIMWYHADYALRPLLRREKRAMQTLIQQRKVKCLTDVNSENRGTWNNAKIVRRENEWFLPLDEGGNEDQKAEPKDNELGRGSVHALPYLLAQERACIRVTIATAGGAAHPSKPDRWATPQLITLVTQRHRQPLLRRNLLSKTCQGTKDNIYKYLPVIKGKQIPLTGQQCVFKWYQKYSVMQLSTSHPMDLWPSGTFVVLAFISKAFERVDNQRLNCFMEWPYNGRLALLWTSDSSLHWQKNTLIL